MFNMRDLSIFLNSVNSESISFLALLLPDVTMHNLDTDTFCFACFRFNFLRVYFFKCALKQAQVIKVFYYCKVKPIIILESY